MQNATPNTCYNTHTPAASVQQTGLLRQTPYLIASGIARYPSQWTVSLRSNGDTSQLVQNDCISCCFSQLQRHRDLRPRTTAAAAAAAVAFDVAVVPD